ncbi:Permeases of the major facilitator superfamily [Geitlerinema sp. FC II]|nr:Permeases of the major facilitator superfamily [Geitlerinema sp. FC II]
MSPTPNQLLDQAKQGDPKAIAALMNRSTQPKGISVKASLNDRCLQVLLEGENAPSQTKSIGFVREGMLKLDIASIDRVRVYGRQVGRETPVWQDEIVLKEAPPPSTPPELSHRAVPLDELADESLLPDDLLEGYYNEDGETLEASEDFPEVPPEAESFLNDEGQDYDEELEEEDDEGQDYDEELEEEDDEGQGYDEELEEEDDEDEDEPPSKPKQKSSLVGLLVLLVLVVLAGGGYYLYTTRPELFSNLPFLNLGGETGDETTPSETPTTPTEDAPDATTPETPDPFATAVNAAMSAAESAQTASTPEQWQQVANNWQTAIDRMNAVPQDHPKYEVAQQKALDYQKNLDYAQQQAQ